MKIFSQIILMTIDESIKRKLAFMPGRLKIKEIAEQTGASASTVSRILSGRSSAKQPIRQAVLESARKLGVLSEMAHGPYLFSHVFIFAPSRAFDVHTDIFYYRIIQGIREMVADQEVRLSYCAIEEEGSDTALFLKKIGDPACEAAIILGIDDTRIHEIAADIGKPCVLVNSHSDSMRLDTVSPDHQKIGTFSTSYLIDQGHRNILVLTCLRRSTMESRLVGVKKALEAKGLGFDEQSQLVLTSGFGMEESREAMNLYFSEHAGKPLPSVILANGDYMAAGAYKAVEENGLEMPTDMSIMSMDGFNLPEINSIALTAVRVPRKELGHAALRMLQRRLLHPEEAYCTQLIGGRLEIGETVKRIGKTKASRALKQKNYTLY